MRFGEKMDQSSLVRARYVRQAAAEFERWPVLDGIGPARFANDIQMNVGLLEIKLL